ncbi:MAG: type II toxin-antitoxin system VapC family toxin [Candidatus Aenigmarchaeota archaeon]|nr:type II toxin-antitoxin system VapC family toxin [Candidatus Aenigmarchaeota archaeon]
MYLIDASVFLEVELQQDRHRECEEFLERVMEGSIRAVISDIEIDSILIVMEREGKKIHDMKKFLSSLSLYKGLVIYSLSLWDRIKALEHSESFRLDIEDAMVVQAAMANGTTYVVSLDSDFDRAKTVKRMLPGEAH